MNVRVPALKKGIRASDLASPPIWSTLSHDTRPLVSRVNGHEGHFTLRRSVKPLTARLSLGSCERGYRPPGWAHRSKGCLNIFTAMFIRSSCQAFAQMHQPCGRPRSDVKQVFWAPWCVPGRATPDAAVKIAPSPEQRPWRAVRAGWEGGL